jgi:hypothetical protein
LFAIKLGMPFSNFVRSSFAAIHNARSVALQGLGVLRSDIAIGVYSLFVFLLVLLTIPLINGILLAVANHLANQSIFTPEHHIVKAFFVAIALFISAACVAMLLSYFTCAVAASTLSQLEGHPAPLLKGLRLFGGRFRHITKFAFVSVAFIPIGFWAQRRKFAGVSVNRAKVEVVGSSLSLSMAQLAPVILSEDKEVYEAVQHSVNTLGKAWREGLVIKISTYIAIFVLTLLIGFLPTLAQGLFFTSSFSQAMSRLLTLLLIICLLITTKVLGTVFTTTLYWQVRNSEQSRKL